MQSDYYLPLFIWGNEPVTIYIASDEIIALERSKQNNNTPWLAYSFISKLARNDRTKKVFPEEILEKLLKDEIFIAPNQPCICGMYNTESYQNWCLAIKLSIRLVNNEKSVQLSDFALLESNNSSRDIYVNNYNYEVQLTAQEAFILFSNICFEATGYHSIPTGMLFYRPYAEKQYNPPSLEQLKNKEKKFTYSVKAFSLDYFKYLSDQIAEGLIDPELVLRLSGARTIVSLAFFSPELREFIVEKAEQLVKSFHTLSQPQKICLAMMVLQSEELSKLIPELAKRYAELEQPILNYLNELTMKFPPVDSGDRQRIFDVFKKYDV